ncbi:piggyBac transposable element-derived protein 3-like [Syngnathoides biaculeatus]|uniref:piggyBac transposable element-derived protein 3-like n=1 Tax=Syngnathoides biaculeatus TaxID=300417 RepID=UPI002ADD5B7B|nr:piggyBac transposable element-derived protein 3-like [Syngnathoides biaculeatus]
MAASSTYGAFSKRRKGERTMDVNEALAILMDDVQDFESADVYIEPPDVHEETDVDSGDENADGMSASVNNLCGNQLSSGCSVTLRTRTGRQTFGQDSASSDYDSTPSDTDSEDGAPITRKRNAPKRTKRVWGHMEFDTEVNNEFDKSDATIRELDLSPAQMFELFFDEEVTAFIVDMTNLYARQKGRLGFKMTASELKLCIAVFLISGYNPLPRKRMYWENAEDVRNEAIASSFPYERFEELLRHLHFADNTKLNRDDKMSKLRPLIAMLNERFLQFWPCTQSINVDGLMVPYYGRRSAKQFIQNKPIRYGYKIWCLNSPSGYLIQYEPYQGAGTVKSFPELGTAGSVVIDLLSELPAKRFNVFFDNQFTSIPLLEELKQKGMHGTGTLRQNRTQKCPLNEVNKMKKQERGSVDYRLDTSSGVLVCRWNDNSVVTVASTVFGVTPTGSVKRWSRKDNREIQIPIPQMILAYNQNMGGTDRMDENIGYYRPSVRINKWWWPLFIAQLSFSVHNAWQLYKISAAATRRRLDQLGFIRDVAMTFILGHRQRGLLISPGRLRPVESRVPDDVRFDGPGHHLISGLTQRRCRQCGKKTVKLCMKCPDCPLHQHCSVLFHTK